MASFGSDLSLDGSNMVSYGNDFYSCKVLLKINGSEINGLICIWYLLLGIW